MFSEFPFLLLFGHVHKNAQLEMLRITGKTTEQYLKTFKITLWLSFLLNPFDFVLSYAIFLIINRYVVSKKKLIGILSSFILKKIKLTILTGSSSSGLKKIDLEFNPYLLQILPPN